MSIYDFKNYKDYINDRIANMPKRGRGQFKKISEIVNVNSVVISQIFKGDRELSLEQANDLSNYLGLNDLEKEYFFLLVQHGRTSNYELKKYFEKQLEKIKSQAEDIKNIVKNERLTEETQSLFYSNWYYSATRLLTSIPGNNTPDRLAERLDLPVQLIKQVVDFLLLHKLIIEEKGKLKMGPQRTHIDASSPFVNRHHINWRLKGFENMTGISKDELFYTSPMTLSNSAMKQIKKLLLEFVVEMSEEVKKAEDEKLVCLNIDFFEVE